MDILLNEIRRKDETAASVLEKAGLRDDSDLQLLTLQDLVSLFPGAEHFKLRREIYNIIHKQKPIGVLINELKDFIPQESLSAALTENGVLVNYLKMLKEMKTQMNEDFLDPHINLFEDFRKSQPLQDQDKGPACTAGEIMDILLNEIRRKDKTAASVLERDYLINNRSDLSEAGLRDDSELQLLTLQELDSLFPRAENIKRRREIQNIIHKQKPIGVLIKELKGFIPQESLRAALTENGVLVDYLKMLKEKKTQLNKMQDFLDAHISLLEDFSKSEQSQDLDKGSASSTSAAPGLEANLDFNTSSCSTLTRPTTSTHDQPPKSQSSASSTSALSGLFKNIRPPSLSIGPLSTPTQTKQVTYKMVVSGETFKAHEQLLEKVETPIGDTVLNLLRQEDAKVIIVFCPVVSRMGTDVEAAMTQVTGGEPVVLVVMHHTYVARPVPSVKTWSESCNVVLCVHVFYHEKVPGLLLCQENNDAISKIQTELLKYSVDITTGDTQRGWITRLFLKNELSKQ